jgi:hypothetical protein
LVDNCPAYRLSVGPQLETLGSRIANLLDCPED